MNVLVLKRIDSASLGRIANPGEIVDIPVDEDDVLFKKGFITFPDDDEALAALEAKGVNITEAPPPDTGTVLLSDRDLTGAEEEDGTN